MKPASNRICSLYMNVDVCELYINIFYADTHTSSHPHLFIKIALRAFISLLFILFSFSVHFVYFIFLFLVVVFRIQKYENKPSCLMSFVVFYFSSLSILLSLNFICILRILDTFCLVSLFYCMLCVYVFLMII